jgi:hypothetical protein
MEKTAGLHPYLKNECFFFFNKNFGYKINNSKGIIHIGLVMLNRKIKPLVIA